MKANVLLTAVGQRAYLVEYFKRVVHPMGGRVYATNMVRDATGFLSADVAEVVPPSAATEYVDVMVALCRKWKVKLLFSLHDWDAPVIARARHRFFEVGTIPVMGSADLLAKCLDKYATAQAMDGLGVPVPKTVLSLAAAEELAKGFGFPLVVKPRWGQGSVGLFVVWSFDELRWAYALSELTAKRFAAACPEIDVEEPQIVVQQCVQGDEYGCDIVNDLAGGFRRAFVKRKFGMRSGETDIAESVDMPQIAGSSRKVGEWSRHLGCMDSDWIVGADGVPRLIELNPRFGGGYPFTHCAGADVPLACVNWANDIDDDDWWRRFRPGVRTFKEIALLNFPDA
ncbi:MAG: ATP-grasp domain-containing protein [Pirellulaceae bacterium]